MELKQVDVGSSPELEKRIKALYYQAFPKEERLPWWLLRLNARRKGIDITAFVAEDRFVGFTASVTTAQMHFLLFFAIAPELRGKGWGSRILSQLKEQYPMLVLNVEPLLEDAPNYPERIKRMQFYEKNGIYDTGWNVWEVGGKFRVLSTKKELEQVAYRSVFLKLTMGLWRVRLEKERKEEK